MIVIIELAYLSPSSLKEKSPSNKSRNRYFGAGIILVGTDDAMVTPVVNADNVDEVDCWLKYDVAMAASGARDDEDWMNSLLIFLSFTTSVW